MKQAKLRSYDAGRQIERVYANAEDFDLNRFWRNRKNQRY
jgi:hypothetical protein